MSQQDQPGFGPGGRHVEQTPGFMALPFPLDAGQEPVNGVGFPPGFMKGRHHQPPSLSGRIGSFHPAQQGRIIRAGGPPQSGENDRIEFQALGLVDAHHLHPDAGGGAGISAAGAGASAGCGEQPLQFFR